MDDSATASFRFALPPLPLQATFDGGRLTSDGGLPWLAAADAVLELCTTVAACVPEWRKQPQRAQHSREMLVRQRLFQLACGYEDQDDADTLRHDPLFKLVCGHLPESGALLASQPTLSRLETAMTRHACRRLAAALVALYLREREKGGLPERILLDLDSTDDPAHGQQEGVAYHGYYRQPMYHPLLIYDGDTADLITAVLRPGTAGASRLVVFVLRRLVAALRARWPNVPIEVRADSGFASPRLYRFCETHQVGFTIGLSTNSRLQKTAVTLQQEALAQRTATGAAKVRLASETRYQAESWAQERRVVFKAEALPKGLNTRFVVTTRTDPPLALYDWYVQRGAPEQWIDQLKTTCHATRLSCHSFWANQFRLLLSVATYWLLHTLRAWLSRAGVPPLRLETLRLQVLKIGARVTAWTDHVRLHLASSHPAQPLWAHLARSYPHRE